MVRPKNLAALELAMSSVLAEAIDNPKADLSFNRVAEVAGVSRATAYRVPNLFSAWEEKVTRHLAAQGITAKNLSPTQRAARKEGTIRALKRTISVMANHIQALTLTVARLEAEQKRHTTGNLN